MAGLLVFLVFLEFCVWFDLVGLFCFWVSFGLWVWVLGTYGAWVGADRDFDEIFRFSEFSYLALFLDLVVLVILVLFLYVRV